MLNLESLPPPREVDLGNGVVTYENAYSIFVRGNFIGAEYEKGYFYNGDRAHSTVNWAFFCPHCGEIWARKILRAFPIWEPIGWKVETTPCDSAILAWWNEALEEYPALLLQAIDAYLLEGRGSCERK